MSDSVNIIFSVLPGIITLGLIIFAIAAIIEGKTTMKKSLVIRSVYFYLASLITLAIVVGSLIFLINTGLKSWVFTEADPLLYRIGPPPTLYMESKATPETGGLAVLACDADCALTGDQKASITTWQENYLSWSESKDKPDNQQRASDIVSALSFLLVALPFFIIHFRIVQKDASKDTESKQHGVIRPVYFYFVSLAALLMIVIAGGWLINTGLKTWVIKSANEDINMIKSVSSPVLYSDSSAVKSLVDCGAKCGLEQSTVDLASRWQSDYSEWENTSFSNNQRQAAGAIPFVLLGIPLFWYHWNVVRKESKEKKEQESENFEKTS
ncbi:MAG: DUF5671 domain-containing protein [Patescibacteria group bacterium]